MTLRLGNILLVTVMLFAILAGCNRTQDMVSDVVVDDIMPDMAMETTPVKIVWLIDYPEGGKDAYLEWIASVAETLQSPKEIVRIRSYDNQNSEMSPHQLVEFHFNSFLDAATYLDRPEIVSILEDLPNHSSNATTYTFIQDADYTYSKMLEDDLRIKYVYLIDYFPGGKQPYLEWATSVAPVLLSPVQIQGIASYDNYYDGSPHRLVEFEFATQEDVDAYHMLEEVIQTAEAELEVLAGKWSIVPHKFELRSDYIKE